MSLSAVFFCGHGSLYHRMERDEVQLTELPHTPANNLTRYSVVVIIIHNFTLDKILMYRPIILSILCNFSFFFFYSSSSLKSLTQGASIKLCTRPLLSDSDPG